MTIAASALLRRFGTFPLAAGIVALLLPTELRATCGGPLEGLTRLSLSALSDQGVLTVSVGYDVNTSTISIPPPDRAPKLANLKVTDVAILPVSITRCRTIRQRSQRVKLWHPSAWHSPRTISPRAAAEAQRVGTRSTVRSCSYWQRQT
jgi:hypothetical protein